MSPEGSFEAEEKDLSTTSEPYIGATRPCDRYVRRERRAYETVNYVLQEFRVKALCSRPGG